MAVIRVGAIHPESCNLKRNMVQYYSDRAVLQSGCDKPLIGKNILNLIRKGRCADIPVMGRSPKEGIPDASSNSVGGKPSLAQAVHQEGDRRREGDQIVLHGIHSVSSDH